MKLPRTAAVVVGTTGVVCAAISRSSTHPAFRELVTGGFSAQNLTADMPRAATVLLDAFKSLGSIYLSEHVMPVYGLLLPSALLLAWGLGDTRLADWLRARHHRGNRGAVLLSIVAFALALSAHYLVIGRRQPVGDEFCYMFQADVLAAGKLVVPSPPAAESFHCWSLINNGGWYAKVTVGWPALLALGKLVRTQALIGPLCCALTIPVIFSIGKIVANRCSGLLAALFLPLSPMFVLHGATDFPHSAAVLFGCLFIYALIVTVVRNAWLAAIGAGICSAFLLHVRPGDGTATFIGSLPLMVHGFVVSRERRSLLKKLGVLAAIFGMGIGALLCVNWIQNGDPFLSGYRLYDPEDVWGFGVNDHTRSTTRGRYTSEGLSTAQARVMPRSTL
ncbi:MAG: glycosyltransferase family 39 protein [Acidobacteriota bacterium]